MFRSIVKNEFNFIQVNTITPGDLRIPRIYKIKYLKG